MWNPEDQGEIIQEQELLDLVCVLKVSPTGSF